MNKVCPYCGAPLHEDASFCPSCAQSINQRLAPTPPNPLPRRTLRMGIALLVLAAISVGFWASHRPVTLEGKGEVIYRDEDGTYQLLLSHVDTRYDPVYEIESNVELDGTYRNPSALFINHKDSGADAGKIFLQKVASATTEFIQPAGGISPMVCSQPVTSVAYPDTTLVSGIDFTGRSGPAELLWTIRMNNGDTILLRQKYSTRLVETHHFYPEDVALGTIQELQALMDEIEQTTNAQDFVHIHLPPITYHGGLHIGERAINLYGSTQGEHRTTFTDTVRVTTKTQGFSFFRDIDFIGEAGVGVSATGRVHVTNCSFTGWKTAVLAYGGGWVNVASSQFEGNDTGFHFNSTGGSVTHTLYTDNVFTSNATAVLLENVPGNMTLIFEGSRFSGNGRDIENLCNHPIDVSLATFQ